MKCGKCCRETEMPLTMRDLKRITSLGYKVHQFAMFNGRYWQLKNVDGHCFFLNPKTNECTIYPHRPEGCKLYPIIYIEGEGVSVDPECPAANTVSAEEIEKAAPKLIKLIMEVEGIEEDN